MGLSFSNFKESQIKNVVLSTLFSGEHVPVETNGYTSWLYYTRVDHNHQRILVDGMCIFTTVLPAKSDMTSCFVYNC